MMNNKCIYAYLNLVLFIHKNKRNESGNSSSEGRQMVSFCEWT